MMPQPDTIAAVATPPGRGGVAIVRISGPIAAEIGAALTRRALPLPVRRAVRAWAYAEDGAVLDDGILLYYAAPASFTGEDVVEFQGHGGPVVVQAILERCLTLGARLARPGEFSERAFLNGKLDLAQAEAIADLIDAQTRAAARAAAQALSGRFSEGVRALETELKRLRVWVEAAIDFVDEEIDFISSGEAAARVAALIEQLDVWIAEGRQGLLLRDGLKLALVGAPNVGKSSLLNALVGEERAIVTDVPGTTRDVIRETVVFEGVPVHVLDTAGVRATDDVVERLGVERTRQALAAADVVVWLRAPGVKDDEVAALLASGERTGSLIEVWNQCDRFPAPEFPASVLRISAKTGEGLAVLRQAVLAAAGWRTLEHEPWLARQRHLEALAAAKAHLLAALKREAQWEFLAEELRLAHEALGRILGQVDAEALLGEIFSSFCIGK